MNKKKLFSILSSTAIFLSLYSTDVPVASANSQKLNDLERQQQELNQKSNQLRGSINEAEKEMNALDAERNQLREDIAEIQANIDRVLSEIKAQEEEIARLEEEIKKLNNEIEILKDKIEKRNVALAKQARGVQTTGSPNNIIDIILSAESLTELIGKMEVINLLVENNNSIMEDQIADKILVEETAAKVEATKEEANQVKQAMEVNRNNLVAQRQELDNKIAIVTEQFELTSDERNSLLGQQQKVAEQTDQINAQMKAERERLAAEKARKEAEAKARAEAQRKAEQEAAAQRKAEQEATAAAARSRKVTTATASASSNSSSSSSSNSGGWARPSNGYVTSEYGYRIHPIYGTRRLHGGIDIGGGGPIRAAKSGVVELAQYSSSYGYYVKIDHGGGLKSLYAHMTPGLQVAPGQSVSQGQIIGTMGTTGSSTGVHLHFEIFRNGTKVNPRNYVNF